ncbi:MAG: N-acetylglucosamine-6-phosphate deacetylase [Sneathiella sp.]|nr:N-acetylglucosamine-6-phosphate deacetylase [Sneathiella sp.]
MIAVTAKHILIGGQWVSDQALLIENGKISAIRDRTQIASGIELKDFGDTYLAPGLFDIQVNGGGDVLLNDEPTVGGLLAIAKAHQKFGTTSLLPTLITDTFETMRQAAAAVAEARAQGRHQIKGIHFEGPFLNTARKGVHHAPYIREFENRFLDLLDEFDLGAVLVTLAPENVPPEFIKGLRARDVVLSMGHTTANFETAKAAITQGVTGLTHLFNAMPPFLSREPGPIGAAFEDTRSFASVIADGHHIHPSTLKTALQLLGPDRSILITDAMPPVGGMGSGFKLMDLDILVEDGRCQTADGTLAGACISMWDAVQYCRQTLNFSIEDCLQMASATPARFMGLGSQIGTLQQGYDADFICFSPDGRILNTHLATEFK